MCERFLMSTGDRVPALSSYQSSAGYLAVLVSQSEDCVGGPLSWIVSKSQGMISISLSASACRLKLCLRETCIIDQVLPPVSCKEVAKLHGT